MADHTSSGIPGIHHVTAICGDPQRNIDFYVGLLGLRLVKKTVNFDDPGSYHLYYGDGVGSPGTIMTFFAWTGLPPGATPQGRAGTEQITATSFSIPAESLDFWAERLASASVEVHGPETRLGERTLSVRDPDGLVLELVAHAGGEPREPWPGGPVPVEHAIRGIHGASLCLTGYEKSAQLLTEVLGFELVGQEGSRFRFRAGEGRDAALVDLMVQPQASPGRMGVGAVHHIAWRAPSRERQELWREQLAEVGLDVTPVLDRQYFESIYFREPGGVIFEIATDAPGFTADEPKEELGTHLKLPPWLESRRDHIEARLPEVHLPSPARPDG